ncbi:putative serine/threonine protein phosphatase [Kitasatospora setae KM-6054]|uniref:Putative serine/threonine protein phosphatase n=1 Tax=Kitasatospora setae (strain ATCC 33774 / DSM 43861 / JCM 3304 / KCC A-0304 / NBRC 14216 / KM-6054) TaxID=452652 RepID=E4NJQ4_KITSK|nr:putative serine/threonine protein phosphatase [Kitasatospora setae KM-6054]
MAVVEYPGGTRADGLPAALSDPARLRAVAATGLMDTGPEEAFDDLVSLAARITGAGRAFVTLVDAERSFWKASVGVDLDDSATRQGPIGQSYCSFLVGAAGEPFVVDDAATDPRTAHHPATGPMAIGAWAGQPLLGPDGHVLGTLCVIDTDPRAWSDSDLATLATLARSVSSEIHLRQALASSRHAHRRSADLARTLQAGLLPAALRTVPGVEAAASYLPASRRERTDIEVGGDFYDLFRTHGDNWAVVMGDVCGKGVQAAQVSSMARYTVRADAADTGSPAGLLGRLHTALLAQGSPRYLTCAYAAFHLTGHGASGTIALGGHPPALVRRADGTVERLGALGTMLGIIPEVSLTDVPFDLAPGELLLLYTDGAIEARPRPGTRPDQAGAVFGEADLIHALADTHGLDAAATIAHLRALLEARHGGWSSDDTALLALRVAQAAAVPHPVQGPPHGTPR